MDRGNQFHDRNGDKNFTEVGCDGGSGLGQHGSWTRATTNQVIAQGEILTGTTNRFEG